MCCNEEVSNFLWLTEARDWGGIMVGEINEKQKYWGGQTNRSIGLNVLFVVLPQNGRGQGHIQVV